MTATTTYTENITDRLYNELIKFGISIPYYSIHVKERMPIEIQKENLTHEIKIELIKFKKSNNLKEFEYLLKTAVGRLFQAQTYSIMIEPHLWIRIIEDFVDEFSDLVGEYCKPEELKENERIEKLFDQVPDWQLTEEIKKEIADNNGYIANYEPMKLYLAHIGLNQVVESKIGKEALMPDREEILDDNVERDAKGKLVIPKIPQIKDRCSNYKRNPHISNTIR